MHTLLLVTHIVGLSLSMLAIFGLTVAALASKTTRSIYLVGTAAVTVIGGLAGVGLLMSRPLGPECVALSAYLALYAGLHAFVSRRQAVLTANAATV